MLKISSVTLANFCQHEHLDIPFSDGLTVVLGPNGSGKSNFLNAIYGAFTGRFDRGPGSIAECIRKDQNEICYVQACGSVAGREFQLRRELHVSGDGKAKVDHSLRLGEERRKTFKTDREIESWLTNVSGLTPEIMAEFLFLAQEDLFGFLKRSDADRSKKFSALCGTRQYEQIRDRFSHFVKEDRIRYETTRLTSEFARQSLEAAQTHRETLQSELTAAKVEFGLLEPTLFLSELESKLQIEKEKLFDLRERERLLARYEREAQAATDRLEKCVKARENLTRTREALKSEQGQIQMNLASLENDLKGHLGEEPLSELVARLNASLQAKEKRTLLHRKIEDTRRQHNDLPHLEPVDTERYLQLEHEHGKFSRRIGELQGQLHPIRTMISVLKQLARADRVPCDCPLCGAEAADWKIDLRTLEDSQRELSHQLEEFHHAAEEIKQQLSDWKDHHEAYQRNSQQRRELSEWITRFEDELRKCPEPDPQAGNRLLTLNELDKRLRDERHKDETVSERLARESELLRERLNEEISLHEELQRVRRQLEPLKLGTSGQDDDETETLTRHINAMEKRLEELRSYEKRVTSLEGGLAEATRRQEAAQMELDRLKGSERDFRYAPSWFGKCEQAVQWLRKDGLPRLVHRSVLKELLAAVNEELAQFQASFRVAVNDDVSFTAIFGSGKQIPSKALSGGEKYILGISFLIAVNRTFAGNLGIMFLDEPTASLDAFHLRLLLRSLQQWKTILHRRQRQLIIVTHVEEMAAIADAVIRFGDEGELLSSPNIAA